MALTPEDVVNKRFQATKFREGYDQDEVDDFLDEVVNELRRLTEENEDLRNKLGSCERRVSELSRASVARESMPEPEAPATIAAAVMPPPPAPAPMPVPQPVMVQEPMRPVAQLEAAAQGQGPEAAAGMLALAQKLHDEYVRNGEQQRDRIVNEAREHAQRLVREAEEKQRQTLGSLEQERSLLERKIDELRAFEREYRSRLKSYLEGQLRELEAKAAVVPNRGPQAATLPAVGNGGAPTYNGPLPSRGTYTSEPTPEPAQSFPFGDRS
ncbi:MAG: DivIVA domain-containing protein [Kineosporiaceae bacterium]